jgi:ankyrin repeat protein
MRLPNSVQSPYDCFVGPPTKTLTRHIKRRDWDGARLRTLTYPSDAHYRGLKGNALTPMHLVCLYRAPLDLIELLIDANPGALFAQDSEGWTPLHLTILYGGDEETVLLLIRRGGKTAASLQSPFAGSPLHLACRHSASLAILEALVQANLDMATAPNECGTTPAEVLWHQFLRQHKNLQVFAAVVDQNDNGNDVSIDHPAVKDLIDRIKILLAGAKAEGKDSVVPHDALQLHDLVSNLSSLGEISPFLDIAVRLYPEQVSTRDNNGNYPLHLVACNPQAGSSKDQFMKHVALVPRDPIEVLVSSYPLTASFKDKNGDLPLHLAIKTGQRKWGKGLSFLIEAYSDALQQKDRETGLFPFQLAAAFPFGNEEECLGTIFELLVACPHVILC